MHSYFKYLVRKLMILIFFSVLVLKNVSCYCYINISKWYIFAEACKEEIAPRAKLENGEPLPQMFFVTDQK